MATPCISAFIVNYNTRDLLEKCIESLFGSKGDISIEVFVADNGSIDGSVEMLRTRFPEVFVKMYSKNVGYTQAINQLLPLAKGAYYLLLHPDIEMLPHAVKTFVGFFEAHPRAGVLGGNLYYPDGTPNPCEILPPGFKNDVSRLAWRLFKRLPCGELLLKNYNPIEWSHKSTARVHWV
ncbi:MAG: glycosyltransferase, partial [Desulfobacterales bacterium]